MMNVGTLGFAPGAEAVETFLRRFFTPPNVQYGRVLSAKGASADSVRAWIELLRTSPGAVALLPCRRGSEREWYGLAFADAQLRQLSEDLLAFVGPSYSTFRGASAQLSLSDPIDKAVLEFTRGHALKFRVPPTDEGGTRAREALDLMRGVLRQRPVLRGQLVKPVGRVLRDFYMALQAGDRHLAERHLNHLESVGEADARLSPVNVLYLRVQLLAEVGVWGELLALPELPHLLAMRRPLAVTQALAAAVYWAQVQPLEERGEAENAVRQFRDSIYPKYAALFTTRAGLRTHEAMTLFLLFAVAGPTPDPQMVLELLRVPAPSDVSARFRTAVAAYLPKAEEATTDALGEALATPEFERGNYDRAFALALDAKVSVKRAGILLDCAYEINSLEAAQGAWRGLQDLSESDRQLVLSDRRRKDSYEWVQTLVGPATQLPFSSAAHTDGAPVARTISGWDDWLAAIEAEPEWPQAQNIAREGAVQWSIADFLGHADGIPVFAGRLTEAMRHDAVLLALPHLLAFFQNDEGWPRPELGPIYQAMLEGLVYTSDVGDEDLAVFHQLTEALLAIGCDSRSYAQLVAHSRDLLEGYAAATRIDWALDMLDLFLGAPCPAPDERLSYAGVMTGVLQRFSRRIRDSQRTLFAELVEELGHPELAGSSSLALESNVEEETAEGRELFARLAGRLVAVYTLTEPASRRFGDALQRRCPSVRVEMSHGHVGSERLKKMAQHADVFVMVTGSAKHAATQFIQRYRPSGMTLLRPPGKGTASMLRILEEYLRSSPEAHASLGS